MLARIEELGGVVDSVEFGDERTLDIVLRASRRPSRRTRGGVARLDDVERLQWRPESRVSARATRTSCGAPAALPGWELELLDARRLPGRDRRDLLRERAREGALRPGVGEPDAWMLGEDSGIEVAALGGAPGIDSARWAERRRRGAARASSRARRPRARYVCELVALAPDGGSSRDGHPRGHDRGGAARRRGFGYDPIFVPLGESRTVAELGNAWKRAHSHRARAAAALAVRLLGDCNAAPLRPVPATLLAPRRRDAELPVHLGAEDDHVRHHVEPDEQQRRRAERLQGDDVVRDSRTKSGSTWNVTAAARRRAPRRARPRAATAARSSAARRRRRGRRRRPPSRSSIESAYATTSLLDEAGREARSRSKPNEPTTSATKSDDQRAGHEERREPLAVQERPVRPAVDDVERRLEHAEERERRPEQERAADDAERGRVLGQRARRRARCRSIELDGRSRSSSSTR